jgi:hypothetical protein
MATDSAFVSAEPVVTAGGITAAVTGLVVSGIELANSFHPALVTGDQEGRIVALVASVSALVSAFVARRKVTANHNINGDGT